MALFRCTQLILWPNRPDRTVASSERRIARTCARPLDSSSRVRRDARTRRDALTRRPRPGRVRAAASSCCRPARRCPPSRRRSRWPARARSRGARSPHRRGRARPVARAASRPRGAFAVFGFGYAAWRAEARLADALPPAWEGEDIAVVGVVDDLPAVSAQRRALRVRRRARRSRRRAACRRGSRSRGIARRSAPTADDAAPAISRRRALAADRAAEAPARQRQSGRLRPRGLAAAAQSARHRLRARRRAQRAARRVRRPRRDYVQRTRERVRDAHRSRARRRAVRRRRRRARHRRPARDSRGAVDGVQPHRHRAPRQHFRAARHRVRRVRRRRWRSRSRAAASRLTTRAARAQARRRSRACAAAGGYVLLAGARCRHCARSRCSRSAALGLWLGAARHGGVVWLWALAGVLLWDPWAALTPGFWLSFGAVGAAAVRGRRVACAHDRAAALARAPRAALREGAHAQWVVTLGLAPLTLALFQQVSLDRAGRQRGRHPGRDARRSCRSRWRASSCRSTRCFEAAHAVLAPLMRCSKWLAALPGAAWAAARAAAVDASAAAHVGVALARSRRAACRAARWALLWLLPLFVVPPPPPPEGAFRLTVLDVGQGLAVVVERTAHAGLRHRPALHRDGGRGRAHRRAVPARAGHCARSMRSSSATRISTTPGGALSLLQTRAGRAGSLSSLPADHPIVAARASARHRGCAASPGSAGRGTACASTCCTRRTARTTTTRREDQRPVVRACASTAGATAARCSPATSSAQRNELLRDAPRRARAPTCSSSRTTAAHVVDAGVRRRRRSGVAVFAAGYRNRFGHPRAGRRRALQAAGRPRAHRSHGAITVTLGPGDELDAAGERDRRRRYWYGDAARPALSALFARCGRQCQRYDTRRPMRTAVSPLRGRRVGMISTRRRRACGRRRAVAREQRAALGR